MSPGLPLILLWVTVPFVSVSSTGGPSGIRTPFQIPPPSAAPATPVATPLLSSIRVFRSSSVPWFVSPAPLTVAGPPLAVAVTVLSLMTLFSISTGSSAWSKVKTVPAASAAPATEVTVVLLWVMRVLLIVASPSTSNAVPLGPASAVEATSTFVRLSSTVLLRMTSELKPRMTAAS